MTLALYGKSRRRRGILGLLAVIAVALAITAGSTLNNGGTASAADTLFTFGTSGSSIPSCTNLAVTRNSCR